MSATEPNVSHDRPLRLLHCVIPEENLLNTPSSKDNVPKPLEDESRAFGCEIINCAGILLGHNVFVINHSMSLFQRYYFFVSLRERDVWDIACAALVVGSKLNESIRNLRDIVRVFDCLRKKYLGSSHVKVADPDTIRRGMPIDASTVELIKNESNRIFDIECDLLQKVGYICYVEQPHRFVIAMCLVLFTGMDAGTCDKIRQYAWNAVNDSFRTTLCCIVPAVGVACGAVVLAAKNVAGLVFPETSPPWCEMFETSTEQVQLVVQTMTELYQLKAPKYVEIENMEDHKKRVAYEQEKEAKRAREDLERSERKKKDKEREKERKKSQRRSRSRSKDRTKRRK